SRKLRARGHRDQLVTSRTELRDQLSHRLDRDLAVLARLVHEDNAAGTRALEDARDERIGRGALPIIAVDVPGNEALREPRERADRARAAAAPRRTRDLRNDARGRDDRAI